MRRVVPSLLFPLALAGACASPASSTPITAPTSQASHASQLPAPDPRALRSPAAFASIADRAARSQALFAEAGRALADARCVNCHPAGDAPTRGELAIAHDPPVARGDDGRGVPGMECAGCHQDRNLDHARVPGAPGWRLAPASMAWRGRSMSAICAQLSDPKQNGGRTLAQIVDHVAHDPLVAWGWTPGADRAPAPGTQAELAALMQAWVDTGAVCP